MKEDKRLRVNVAAQRLGKSPRRVQQLIAEGKLPVVEESPRRRFVPESALEAFREDHSD